MIKYYKKWRLIPMNDMDFENDFTTDEEVEQAIDSISEDRTD